MAEPELYKAACQAYPCLAEACLAPRGCLLSEDLLSVVTEYFATATAELISMTLKYFPIHATGFFICSVKFKLPEFQLL